MVFLAFSGCRGVRFPSDNAPTATCSYFDRRYEARGNSRRDRHDAARGRGYGTAARR